MKERVIDYKALIDVPSKRKKADIVITNGQLVNVFSREIYRGGLAIVSDRIAAIGEVDGYIGEETRVIDAKNGFITPGLIDGHVHIESSMLSVVRFAELALLHGVTSVMSDLHEVAVVGGLDTIFEVLNEAERSLLKIYFVIPSHVPFSPGYETTGAVIGPDEVRRALDYPRCAGLSEVVVTSALGKEERLWKAMELVRGKNGLLHGHGPFMKDEELAAFSALGIRTDHEAFTMEDGIARLRAGIHLQIRQGSAAESASEIIKVITQEGLDSSNASIVTDDILAEDLFQKGYQDVNVRLLQKNGIDPITAIQMVTINPAKAFRIEHEVGVLAPGRQADVVIVDDLKEFIPVTVLARGTVVLEDGKKRFSLPEPAPSQRQLNSIKIQREILPADLKNLARASRELERVKVNILVTPVDIPVPKLETVEVEAKEGFIQPDAGRDIAAIAVAERHRGTGNLALAFIKGFALEKGAMASSVAHDHHNIVGIGTNYGDLALAINQVGRLQGGQVVVEDGEILAEMPLSILGLMSPEPVDVVCDGLRQITDAARKIGCKMRWPHMFLSFMTCSSGPGYSITDLGLLDGYEQRFLPLIVDK